jgi:hypothetical protein
MLMGLIVVVLHRSFLEGTVHALHLAVSPGMIALGQPLLNTMPMADAVEDMGEGESVALADSWIVFELFLGRLVIFDVRQAAMPRRLRQRCWAERVRWGSVACKAYRQSSSVSRVCLQHATIGASSAGVNTAECGCFGPIGASLTCVRFFHFATVLGLIP